MNLGRLLPVAICAAVGLSVPIVVGAFEPQPRQIPPTPPPSPSPAPHPTPVPPPFPAPMPTLFPDADAGPDAHIPDADTLVLPD
jgi:hypothetical protein